MTKRPNPPKEMKVTFVWVVVDPWGSPLLATARDSRGESMRTALVFWPDTPWKRVYREGYRCRRVMLALPISLMPPR